MHNYLAILTWILAVAGAVSALGAALGRGRLPASWVNRLYLLAYLVMGVSVALFILRGFIK